MPLLFLANFVVLQLQCSYGLPLQNEPRQIYIIYLGGRQSDDADLVTASHHDLLASVVGSKQEAVESIIYSYRHGFSGFAALLTKSQSTKIAGLPGVVSVTKNRVHHTRTTRSWDFVGLHYNDDQPNGLLAKAAKYGDDVIVGVIDSGFWPESPSYADHGYGPPPSRWKGVCQGGGDGSFGPNNCNRKVIGARWYAAGVSDKETLKGSQGRRRPRNPHLLHGRRQRRRQRQLPRAGGRRGARRRASRQARYLQGLLGRAPGVGLVRRRRRDEGHGRCRPRWR